MRKPEISKRDKELPQAGNKMFVSKRELGNCPMSHSNWLQEFTKIVIRSQNLDSVLILHLLPAYTRISSNQFYGTSEILTGF